MDRLITNYEQRSSGILLHELVILFGFLVYGMQKGFFGLLNCGQHVLYANATANWQREGTARSLSMEVT